MDNVILLVKFLGFAAIFSLLFGACLKLPLHDFLANLKQFSLISRVFLANFIVVPFFALGLCTALHLPLNVSIAILLLSFAPYAPAVPKLAYVSRADFALSVSLTALFGLVSIVTTPLLCKFLLPLLPGAGPIEVNTWGIAKSLASTIILPTVLGLAIQHFKPQAALQLSNWVVKFANIVLGLLVLAALLSRLDSLKNISGYTLFAMLIACLAFGAVGYNFGGGDEGTRRVTSLGSELRHPSVATFIATEHFANLHVPPSIILFFLLSFVVVTIQKKIWAVLDRRRSPVLT